MRYVVARQKYTTRHGQTTQYLTMSHQAGGIIGRWTDKKEDACVYSNEFRHTLLRHEKYFILLVDMDHEIDELISL